MDAPERANWFDTEGNLYVTSPGVRLADSSAALCISQADPLPLKSFREGAETDGVESVVIHRRRRRHEYVLIVTGLEDISRELVLELPYLRNQRKLRQIKKFIGFLRRERKVVKPSLQSARRIFEPFVCDLNPCSRPMQARERATWHETEGCLNVSARSAESGTGADLQISQIELPPLVAFANGAAIDGISSSIYTRTRKSGIEYILRIRRLDHVAAEISRESPFFRTAKTVGQVRMFKEYVFSPRQRISKSLETARRLLL